MSLVSTEMYKFNIVLLLDGHWSFYHRNDLTVGCPVVYAVVSLSLFCLSPVDELNAIKPTWCNTVIGHNIHF